MSSLSPWRKKILLLSCMRIQIICMIICMMISWRSLSYSQHSQFSQCSPQLSPPLSPPPTNPPLHLNPHLFLPPKPLLFLSSKIHSKTQHPHLSQSPSHQFQHHLRHSGRHRRSYSSCRPSWSQQQQHWCHKVMMHIPPHHNKPCITTCPHTSPTPLPPKPLLIGTSLPIYVPVSSPPPPSPSPFLNLPTQTIPSIPVSLFHPPTSYHLNTAVLYSQHSISNHLHFCRSLHSQHSLYSQHCQLSQTLSHLQHPGSHLLPD